MKMKNKRYTLTLSRMTKGPLTPETVLQSDFKEEN